jgi:hypothetical protein
VFLIVNIVQKFEQIWMVIFCRIDDWMNGVARVLEIASGRSRIIRQDGADSPAPWRGQSGPLARIVRPLTESYTFFLYVVASSTINQWIFLIYIAVVWVVLRRSLQVVLGQSAIV